MPTCQHRSTEGFVSTVHHINSVQVLANAVKLAKEITVCFTWDMGRVMEPCMEGFRSFCLTELAAFNSRSGRLRLGIEETPPAGIMFDYRVGRKGFVGKCINIIARDADKDDAVGLTTALFIDDDAARQFDVYQVIDGHLEKTSVSSVMYIPCVAIGFSTIITSVRGDRISLARWFISFAKNMRGMGINLFVEACGCYREGSSLNWQECLGKVNPGSRPVLSMTRMLGMERIGGCYELNTLGPLYRLRGVTG